MISLLIVFGFILKLVILSIIVTCADNEHNLYGSGNMLGVSVADLSLKIFSLDTWTVGSIFAHQIVPIPL